MNTNKARDFLEAILAQPDEDAPRLIFADWLEEQGDTIRAEFIRVQIERARLPEWDARQVRLRLREKTLIQEHGLRWSADLPTIEGLHWEEFRRGFLATVRFTSFAALRTKVSDCWTAAPIEAVTVPWPRQRDAIGGYAPLAGLRELTVIGHMMNPREAGRLAHAAPLSTLRTLNIRHAGLGVAGFRRLLASPHLGNLTALRVPGNSIGNGGIGALFNAASLTSLAELDLSETGSYHRYAEDPIIEATGAQALAAWAGLARLRSLTLSDNAVGRDGLRSLLRSPNAAGLKELVLRGNGLTGTVMQEFGGAHVNLQLDVLDLGENLLRDVGAEYLARAACLAELKVLKLDRCEIALAGSRKLVTAPFVRSLRKLNVRHNSFGPEVLRTLLQQEPPALHTLEMYDNILGDEGTSHLAESPASDALLEVDLGANGLGDHSAQALAESKHLRNLLVLELNPNQMSDTAAAALANSSLGQRLLVLNRAPEEIPF